MKRNKGDSECRLRLPTIAPALARMPDLTDNHATFLYPGAGIQNQILLSN